MMPICNRPMIAFLVDQLIAAGVREMIVNLHYLPEPIERYLPAAFPEARFHFSFEQEILGTGGAIRRVRRLLENEEDFFVLNGDTIQRPPLDRLRDARRAGDALAAMTLRHPPAGDRYTAVWFEPHGAITGFGTGRGEPLMYSGSQCVSRRVFEHLPDREVSEIVGDVYASTSEPLAGVINDDPLWFDIGTRERYLIASTGMLEAMERGEIAVPAGSRLENGSLIHETAVVRGRVTRSVVGARSVIDGTIEECIVWDDCRVPAGANLRREIISSP